MLKDINLYYVGGYVRDEILGIPNADIDYCYEGNAIEFSKELNVLKTNPSFGTVSLDILGQEIDIASTRKEYYPRAGHLPVIKEIGCSLKDDLKRRDFTVNAMAKNTLTGELFDYYNGMEDIENKTLCVLHDRSFIDDPTRIVRGLKFSVRLGFQPDEHTMDLQKEYLANINYDMSYHRLKKELMETLLDTNAYQMFVEQDIYKLLGENQPSKEFLLEKINDFYMLQKDKNWLMYLAPFNLSAINFSKQEQKNIESYRSCISP